MKTSKKLAKDDNLKMSKDFVPEPVSNPFPDSEANLKDDVKGMPYNSPLKFNVFRKWPMSPLKFPF